MQKRDVKYILYLYKIDFSENRTHYFTESNHFVLASSQKPKRGKQQLHISNIKKLEKFDVSESECPYLE